MSKYFLSMCVIIKDEAYLEEFIMYNYLLGFEHFYIYDNDSFNPIPNRLTHYLFKKLCTVIRISGSKQQLNAYNHCRKVFGRETRWLANFDGDEYIFPKNVFSMKDFLKNYEEFDAIGINWVMFGSSFHDNVQNKYVIDAYRWCDNVQNKHIKTIYKPLKAFGIRSNPHCVILKNPSKYCDAKKNIISGPYNNNYTIDIIQINHYFSKSKEDSINKIKRGRALSSSFGNLLNLDTLHLKNNKIIDDLCPNKYLDKLTALMKTLNINWEIYRVLNKDLHQFTEKNDVFKHFYTYGINEPRCLKITDKYPTFDTNSYRSSYESLKNLTDTELEKQYILESFKESESFE
jgi:hypothetical protein